MAGAWDEGAWRADLQGFAALLYTDRAVVWRGRERKRENGSTVTVREALEGELPCRISRISSRKDAFGQGMPQQELDYEARLYLAPDSDLRAGDLIEVRRGGSGWLRRYLAGDAFVYASHMEVPLRRTEEA